MKSLLWTLAAVALVAGLTGCCCTETTPCVAQDCGCTAQVAAPTGPPSAAITYPYYTTRGPRDFLAANPPSIGP